MKTLKQLLAKARVLCAVASGLVWVSATARRRAAAILIRAVPEAGAPMLSYSGTARTIKRAVSLNFALRKLFQIPCDLRRRKLCRE